MSQVKMNNSRFEEIESHIKNAKELSLEALELDWEQNFGNLYYNFITNGFLESLYKDAESNYKMLFGGGSALICGAGSAIAGTAAATGATAVTIASVSFTIPVVGWIIGAIILGLLAIVGIVYLVQSAANVQFKYDARNIFEKLLTDCAECTQGNYLMLKDVDTRLETARLNLENVIKSINEFNESYQNMTQAAEDANVKLRISTEDGVTVLGIESHVNIDGEEISILASEAMNAVFTYNETIMNAKIAVDYLQSQGYDIDFLTIVQNTNSFMANTLRSGLYSNDFILGVFPSLELPGLDAVKGTSAEYTGLSENVVDEMLKNALGSNYGVLAASGALLLGTNMLKGAYSYNKPTTNGGTQETPSGGTPSGGTPSGGTPSGGTPSGGTPSGGTGPSPSDTGTTGNNDSEEKPIEDEKPIEENPEEESQINEILIPEIKDIEVPEEYKSIYEVDYDELARQQYEFEGDFNKIMEERTKLITEVEAQYDSGNLAPLSEKLQEFGYTSTETEVILASRFLTSKAILEGTQRTVLAQNAMALAKADGVEGFVSKYTQNPGISNLSETTASEELTLASQDKRVTKAYNEMKTKREEYTGKVKDANEALVDVSESKKTMEDIKAKYEKEFGTDDTTKWSEEAAQEYSDSIEKYNESLENANSLVEEAETAEEAYKEANTAFETAKDNFKRNGVADDPANDLLAPGDATVRPGFTVENTGGSGLNIDTTSNPNGNTGNGLGLDPYGTSDKPNFAEVAIRDGVVVDSSLDPNSASSGLTGTTGLAGTTQMPNQDLMNAAVAMSTTEQILNSLKEEDGQLIQN